MASYESRVRFPVELDSANWETTGREEKVGTDAESGLVFEINPHHIASEKVPWTRDGEEVHATLFAAQGSKGLGQEGEGGGTAPFRTNNLNWTTSLMRQRIYTSSKYNKNVGCLTWAYFVGFTCYTEGQGRMSRVTRC